MAYDIVNHIGSVWPDVAKAPGAPLVAQKRMYIKIYYAYVEDEFGNQLRILTSFSYKTLAKFIEEHHVHIGGHIYDTDYMVDIGDSLNIMDWLMRVSTLRTRHGNVVLLQFASQTSKRSFNRKWVFGVVPWQAKFDDMKHLPANYNHHQVAVYTRPKFIPYGGE